VLKLDNNESHKNKRRDHYGITESIQTASRDERTQPRTQKITTFLWFDNNAEEAVNFYVPFSKTSKVFKLCALWRT